MLNPVDEAPWVSTNEASQWARAAIANLALIGDAMPVAPGRERRDPPRMARANLARVLFLFDDAGDILPHLRG